ncbi:MAG TPA: hypothetical protein VFU40_10110 [Gemmatimonadales bacterium]|nr:hypothetical protein [Gemmatimonadales bacterium]
MALLWCVIYSVVNEYRHRRPDFRIVLQEDLSRDPVGQYAQLYRSVGLAFTAEAKAAVTASSSAGNPKETPPANPYQTRIDSVANLGSWKRRLTAEEVGRIRRLTAIPASVYYPDSEW